MRLGQRPARIRPGGGGQLITAALPLLVAGGLLSGLALVRPADAEDARVGPARIVCNAAFCQMGSGARPKERFRVIVSDLPQEEIHRLRKCTGIAKPCIVTIEGIERGGPMRVTASSIQWADKPE